jgi:hypothetical protein
MQTVKPIIFKFNSDVMPILHTFQTYLIILTQLTYVNRNITNMIFNILVIDEIMEYPCVCSPPDKHHCHC